MPAVPADVPPPGRSRESGKPRPGFRRSRFARCGTGPSVGGIRAASRRGKLEGARRLRRLEARGRGWRTSGCWPTTRASRSCERKGAENLAGRIGGDWLDSRFPVLQGGGEPVHCNGSRSAPAIGGLAQCTGSDPAMAELQSPPAPSMRASATPPPEPLWLGPAQALGYDPAWAELEFGFSSHADDRLRKRMPAMARAWEKRSGAPVSVVFPETAAQKAACRLLSNPGAGMEDIFENHRPALVFFDEDESAAT